MERPPGPHAVCSWHTQWLQQAHPLRQHLPRPTTKWKGRIPRTHDARGLGGHDQFPGRQTLVPASADKPSGEVEITRAEAKLVGVPYGSELYIETYLLLQWLAKTQELLTEIANMGSVQDQLLLLRACAHPHVAYWNRLLPSDYPFKDLFLAQHDNIVLGTLPVYCAWSGQTKPNRPAAYADWVAPSPRGHELDSTTLPD